MSHDNKHFVVQTNESVGRFAVASKELQPGDVIFEETPFAYGPKSDHPPMCLGCYLPVDLTYLCSQCGWPVCNNTCETNPAHKDAECAIFAKANIKFQSMEDPSQICLQYECITPLRVLAAKETDPQRWNDEISKMEAHNDKRRGTAIWNFYQTNIVEYLRGPCKLESQYSEELIHTVCGILDVNAFEAHVPSGGYSIRCLYPNLAILSHNCISNIAHSIINDDCNQFKVSVRAAINVKEGDELFSSYTYSITPTLVRRAFLKESKYFECTCKRCSDPTELGTHMGTLKCSKCDNGVILSQAPLDFEATWKCTHCPFATKATAVHRLYQIVQTEIDNVDATVDDAEQAIEARETLFRKYRSVFHPRNAYHTILRIGLAQMYGKCDGYALKELPDLLLERKIELCQQVLENLNVVEPGFTRTRGMILYEMHAPLMLLTRNMYRSKMIDKKELRSKLEEVIKLLKESAMILSLEPVNSPEGQLGIVARQGLAELEQNIDELVNAEF